MDTKMGIVLEDERTFFLKLDKIKKRLDFGINYNLLGSVHEIPHTNYMRAA